MQSSNNLPQKSKMRSNLYGWLGDRIFFIIITILSLILMGTTLLLALVLFGDGAPAFKEFGFFQFIAGKTWDPGLTLQFGTYPFILGTLVTSIGSLILSFVPAIAVAVFMVEYCPKWLASIIDTLINLIAAIPSVVIGIWGIFVLVPWVRETLYFPLYYWALDHAPATLPIIGNPIGYGLLTATIVLTIMIIPYTTVLTAEAIRKVPRDQREAAYGLGATKLEVIWMAILPYARGGILSGSMLSFGRAIGETMAVAMLIGNSNSLPFTLLGPAATMPSVIVNEFREAVGNMHLSSLMAIGFILFLISLTVNLTALWLQKKFAVAGGRAV